jgi:hypothetical protein
MSMNFTDDDPGFIRWRDTHPDGLIVNHERQPKPRYFEAAPFDVPDVAGRVTQPWRQLDHRLREDLQRGSERVAAMGSDDRRTTRPVPNLRTVITL